MRFDHVETVCAARAREYLKTARPGPRQHPMKVAVSQQLMHRGGGILCFRDGRLIHGRHALEALTRNGGSVTFRVFEADPVPADSVCFLHSKTHGKPAFFWGGVGR